jgi:hypothetical protein
MPWLTSPCSVTRSGAIGWVKLGQPDPESYLSALSNTSLAQATQR